MDTDTDMDTNIRTDSDIKMNTDMRLAMSRQYCRSFRTAGKKMKIFSLDYQTPYIP